MFSKLFKNLLELFTGTVRHTWMIPMG